MSYGVWRKRGKGWSSIEIDSPWNYTFHDMADRDDKKATSLKRRIGCSYNDNPHYGQWSYTQEKNGRQIIDLPTDGEHTLSVAYDDAESLQFALKKLEGYYWKEKFEEDKARQTVVNFLNQI